MFEVIRTGAAVALWTSSTAMMITGTIWRSITLMAWGGYVALVACLVTAWIIVDCAVRKDRLRVREIVRLVEEYRDGATRLPRVGR